MMFVVGTHGACTQLRLLDPELDTCQNNYGRRLKPEVQPELLNSVIIQIKEKNPLPCCNLCIVTQGCSYYLLEIKNGEDAVCELYKLNMSTLEKNQLLNGELYDKVPGYVIGYTNVFLDI
jgi:hypothetical protein